MYSGADFGADFGVMKVLNAMDQMRRSPSFEKELGLELRGDATGEVWDYFETGVTRAEVKLNPSAFEEVRQFVNRAHASSQRHTSGQFELIFGIATGALAPLKQLIDDALATSSLSDFRERVNDRDGVKRIATILNHLKGDAYLLLRRMKMSPYPPDSVRMAQQLVAANLVGQDRAQELINAVKPRLIDRAKQQRPWKVYELLRDLIEAGFVFQTPAVTSLDDLPGGVHAPLVALQVCGPYELPTRVLAAIANVSPSEMEEKLASVPIVAGRSSHWQMSGEWPFDDTPFTTHLARGLKGLIALIKEAPDNARVSSYIQAAVALATRLKDRAPELVMTFFVDLDRDLKRLGNKQFVSEVADLSLQAARIYRTATKQTGNTEVVQQIREARARTLTCGICWQLQRTGRLEHAEAKAREALELRPSATTHAFSVKCMGRLRRLQAEEKLRDPSERLKQLQDSEDFLIEAIGRFEALPNFSHARLEMGDCYSLLGRTMLVREDLARAKAYVAKADDLLEGYEHTKAMLDLKLLRADIFRAEGKLAAAVSEYDSLLYFPFSNDAEQNEIKARLHEALGATLVALNRREEGLRHYTKAIGIYTALDETRMVERVTLNMLARDGMPKGLVDLLFAYPDHLILHALETATTQSAHEMRRSNVQEWSTDQWRSFVEKVTLDIAIPAGEVDW